MRMSGIHRLRPVNDHRPGIGDYDVELAQVTMFMTLGVMAAAIAHVVNQPLSGIITYACTSLRMPSSPWSGNSISRRLLAMPPSACRS